MITLIFFRTFVPDMKKEIRKISGIWDFIGRYKYYFVVSIVVFSLAGGGGRLGVRRLLEAEIPGRLLHRCVPRLLRAQVVREPVPAQRLAAHLPRYLRRLEVAYRSNVPTFLGKPPESGLRIERPPRGDGVGKLALGVRIGKSRTRYYSLAIALRCKKDASMQESYG